MGVWAVRGAWGGIRLKVRQDPWGPFSDSGHDRQGAREGWAGEKGQGQSWVVRLDPRFCVEKGLQGGKGGRRRSNEEGPLQCLRKRRGAWTREGAVGAGKLFRGGGDST